MALEVAEVIVIIVGIVIGFGAIYLIMQKRVSTKAQQLFDTRKGDLEGQYQQRNQDLEGFISRRNTELDEQYRMKYSTEFEAWQSKYLLDHEVEVQEMIKAAKERALSGSRSTLKGRITEQIAPLFPEFMSKYVAADARFLGSPIDFIVFKNLHTLSRNPDTEPKPIEIVFVEVKVDKSKLTPTEKAVKDAVENLRIKYDLLKIQLDDKTTLGAVDASTTAESLADLDGTKQKAQVCPRCQYGLKCDCNSCPNCPNNYTLESDAQA